MAREANRELLEVPPSFSTKETAAVLRVVSAQLGSPQEQTRLDALHWVHTLLRRDQRLVRVCAGLPANASNAYLSFLAVYPVACCAPCPVSPAQSSPI